MSEQPIRSTRNFGNLLKKLRRDRGWSQERMAEEAGLSGQDYVSHIENDKANVSLEVALDCLAVLGYELSPQKRPGPDEDEENNVIVGSMEIEL